MAWLPEDLMADIHVIRQECGRAKETFDADPTESNKQALTEAQERRSRAVRSLWSDGDSTIRHLAAMFRISRGTIRQILEEEE
jgi:DNA-directed RNA polymerase sigma subunit (sigma70/sigma32)